MTAGAYQSDRCNDRQVARHHRVEWDERTRQRSPLSLMTAAQAERRGGYKRLPLALCLRGSFWLVRHGWRSVMAANGSSTRQGEIGRTAYHINVRDFFGIFQSSLFVFGGRVGTVLRFELRRAVLRNL